MTPKRSPLVVIPKAQPRVAPQPTPRIVPKRAGSPSPAARWRALLAEAPSPLPSNQVPVTTKPHNEPVERKQSNTSGDSDNSVRTRLVRPKDVAPDRVKSLMSYDSHRYRPSARLGKGAYGVVWSGVDSSTGDRVAIKEVDAKYLNASAKGSQYARKEANLLREIGIQVLLQHPNVVCLRSLVFHKLRRSLWLVLDLVDGGTLEKYTRSKVGKRLSAHETQECTQQIAVGLAYLHYCNVAHRDLKPENILRQCNGSSTTWKIADFGLANVQSLDDTQSHCSSAVQLHSFCGTPYYIAPEVHTSHQGKSGYSGFAADVWSFGVLVYETLVGDVPFKKPDLPSLARAVCNEPVRVPSFVPTAARNLLQEMLAKDPTKRPRVRELADRPWLSACKDRMQFNAVDGDAAANEVFRLTCSILDLDADSILDDDAEKIAGGDA